MQTVAEWLAASGFHDIHLLRDDMEFLLAAPCNQPIDANRPMSLTVMAFRKKRADLAYRLGKVPVHGIGATRWDALQAAGKGAWLVIAETEGGDLLALEAAGEVPDYTAAGDKKGIDAGGMAYFRKARFIQMADLSGTQQRLGFERVLGGIAHAPAARQQGWTGKLLRGEDEGTVRGWLSADSNGARIEFNGVKDPRGGGYLLVGKVMAV